MIQDRILSIKYLPQSNSIIASGRKGQVYILDSNLQVQKRSPMNDLYHPINAMVVNETEIFTRDTYGNVVKWDLATLTTKEILYAQELRDHTDTESDAANVTSPSHAIALQGTSLFVSTGYGKVAEIDTLTFTVKNISDPTKNTFLECINLVSDTLNVLSDFAGNLYYGDLKRPDSFQTFKADRGPIHCVTFDPRYNRFLFTTDNSYSLGLFNPAKRSIEKLKITNDDLEWIDLNNDFSLIYVACFDHYLHVFTNDINPRLKQKIGPFKFQLKQVLCTQKNELFVLLESGEIYKLNETGELLAQSPWRGNAIWTTDVHPTLPNQFYSGLEDGSVLVSEVMEVNNSVTLRTLARLPFKFGRIRRALPLSDSSFIGISTSGYAFRATKEGQILWEQEIGGILRDVAFNSTATKALIGSENGLAIELNTLNGAELDKFNFEAPIWAVCYDHQDRRLVAERRHRLHVFDADSNHPVKRIDAFDNIKRLKVVGNSLIVNGPGAIWEVDLDTWQIKTVLREWLTTTCENALVLNQKVYGISYNCYLTTHDRSSGEILDVQGSLFDFPKGLVHYQSTNSKDYLFVSGRGPYFALFQMVDGIPLKTKDFFIEPLANDKDYE